MCSTLFDKKYKIIYLFIYFENKLNCVQFIWRVVIKTVLNVIVLEFVINIRARKIWKSLVTFFF